jgi:CheY-like chemotaxis protein
VRVLIADDSPDIADSLAMILGDRGHEVHTAYDGVAAIARAEELRPDVVILDIGLPELDGLEAVRHIRAQPWGGTATLIAITGWAGESARRASVAAGFDYHLVKPLEPRDLVAVVGARALKTSR